MPSLTVIRLALHANEAVKTELDFNDRQDFEDASRGFIATVNTSAIMTEDGKESYSLEGWDFLKNDIPETANPSLWRQSQLNRFNGLFEVIPDKLYQVRGFDIANMTFIRSDHGWIIIDVTTTNAAAKAGYDLIKKHVADLPVEGVIFTHPHGDHYGGIAAIREGSSKKDFEIIAPKGFMASAQNENVLAGVAMTRRATYMYGLQLEPSVTGNLGCGLGQGMSTGSKGIARPTIEIETTGEKHTIDGVEMEFVYVREIAVDSLDALCHPDGTISTRLVSTYDQEDVAVAAEQAAWVNTVDDMLGEKIAVADTKFYITDPVTGKRRIRSGETNLGDFVADGIYTYFNEVEKLHCDVAIMNGGGIRADVPAGDWTFKTCKQVSPFGNVACLMSVTGKQIQDALEFAARFAGAEGKENGGFLQVAGATYEIHTDIPNTVQTDDKNVWIGSATGTPRVQNVKIYDRHTGTYEPLDPAKTYALAGMNYTLRNLGDGFAMFDGAELIKDYVSEDYLVMSTYAMTFGGVDAEGLPHLSSANSVLAEYPGYLLDYENPYGAGRISIL